MDISKSSDTWTMGICKSSINGTLSPPLVPPVISLTFHSQSIFCTAFKDSASLWCRNTICSLIFSHLSSTSCNHDRNSRPLYLIIFRLHFAHCSKTSFLVQKFNFDFPRKLSNFFWLKNSWKCCGFGLFSCWQLWFHEKNCQKKFGWKTRERPKLNFWTKIWLL